MESIWSTSFLFDSGASDASKNNVETLIFFENVKETRKKKIFALSRIWTQVLWDKRLVLYQLSYVDSDIIWP